MKTNILGFSVLTKNGDYDVHVKERMNSESSRDVLPERNYGMRQTGIIFKRSFYTSKLIWYSGGGPCNHITLSDRNI